MHCNGLKKNASQYNLGTTKRWTLAHFASIFVGPHHAGLIPSPFSFEFIIVMAIYSDHLYAIVTNSLTCCWQIYLLSPLLLLQFLKIIQMNKEGQLSQQDNRSTATWAKTATPAETETKLHQHITQITNKKKTTNNNKGRHKKNRLSLKMKGDGISGQS